MRCRGVATVAVLVGAVGALAPSPASAGGKPILMREEVHFHDEAQEQAVIDNCGADLAVDVVISGTFSTKLFLDADGTPDRVIDGGSHIVVETTSRATGASTTNSVTGTAHVELGAGTDGRDSVRITGKLGQLRLRGDGVVAMDAGQIRLESFGPADPDARLLDIVGRQDSGPFPYLCDVAAALAAS